MKFGEWLRRKRLEAALSQRQLGELAGIAPNRVSDIENGRNPNLTMETVERLYRALGDSPPWDTGRYLASLSEPVASYA